jgi:hypothetical protein
MAQVQQPFSSVQVNINEIKDEELKMKIEFEMSKYDDCRRAQTEAANQVVLAGAALLAAQSARAISRIKLVRLFGEGSDKVAMEPNWEPFRQDGRPALENFMSERDQRNFQRAQRLSMNKQVTDTGGNYGTMFETGDES